MDCIPSFPEMPPVALICTVQYQVPRWTARSGDHAPMRSRWQRAGHYCFNRPRANPAVSSLNSYTERGRERMYAERSQFHTQPRTVVNESQVDPLFFWISELWLACQYSSCPAHLGICGCALITPSPRLAAPSKCHAGQRGQFRLDLPGGWRWSITNVQDH
jgi:hypothetical protein